MQISSATEPIYGKISLISIPRDLWVSIPGWENQRINTAYQHGVSVDYPGGGPGLLKDTILYNLGIRIDHILLTPQAADRLETCGIDAETRSREKPSDHVPIWVTLEDA